LEHAQQIAAQFNAAAQNYSNILQPYAIKLFFSLLLIDIVVTYVQYTADQLEPMRYLGVAAASVRKCTVAGFTQCHSLACEE
jgi:hypothetical protein